MFYVVIAEQEEEDDGAVLVLDNQRKGKCAVIKTSTRQTYFLPVIGLVDSEKLKPGDLVGVNKDSYLILETLPAEYDARVKAMEVDERPTEQYSDIGGLDKTNSRADRSRRLADDTQGSFQEPRHSSTEGCVAVRSTRYRQNPVGSCLRCTDQVDIFEVGRSTAGADVHR